MLLSQYACLRARRSRSLVFCAALAIFTLPAVGAAQELTLAEALSRAVNSGPLIDANNARRGLAQTGLIEAKISPPDVVGVEVENFAGTGPYSLINPPETSAWYERTWERGGKMQARMQAAQARVETSKRVSRLALLDYLEEVQIAWVNALAADAAILVADQRLSDARNFASDVHDRVASALDPLFAAERATTSVAQAELALDQAKETARIARTTLASYWAGDANFQLPASALHSMRQPQGPVDTPPELELLNRQHDVAQADLRLAESANVGNVTGRIGLRHFGQDNNLAIMVGGSIPLGNRAANRGNVARARAEVQVLDADMAVTRQRIERELVQMEAQRASMLNEVERIEQSILPSANRALRLVRSGFARGGTAFTFLEISQAQLVLTDAQSRRLELLRQYHLAGARLDRLTGRHTKFVENGEPQQ